jgi:hypothetical protein
MNAEFNWWLLIVGLVLGAALTWLVMADTTRREIDVAETERRGEALWISALLSRAGRSIDATRVEEVLRLHREYLAAPPPDEPVETLPPAAADPAGLESRAESAGPAAADALAAEPAAPARPLPEAEAAAVEIPAAPYSAPTRTGSPATESPSIGASETPKRLPGPALDNSSTPPTQ